MALYWPDAKVALDIIDDPDRRPFEGGDDYTVLRVCCADFMDPESFAKTAARLRELLGQPDESHDDDGLDNIEIIARTEEEATFMRDAAQRDGRFVRSVSLWNGPIPEGSFEIIGDGLRMSTPEYMFYRKANQLPFVEAIQLGNELCGRFSTVLTCYNSGDDFEYLSSTRTSTSLIRKYLKSASGTKEGKRARRVLRYVCDEAGSPMASYLHTCLCLPPARGGYGIARPELCVVIEGEENLLPSPHGSYLAYDMFWPEERVALQYVGKSEPTENQLSALQAEGVRAVCVTRRDACEPKRLHRVACKLAELLGKPLGDDTRAWKAARKKLCSQIEPPQFDDMRITLDDIQKHYR